MSHHTQDRACPLCQEKLRDAHPVLQDWFLNFVKPKFPGAHISWSYRGPEDQNRFFEEGKTRCRFPHSKHNKKPSLALDLFQIRADQVAAWPKEWFAEIAADARVHNDPIHWGGNFKSIGDQDHFQLKEP